jgi:hypothetical protein
VVGISRRRPAQILSELRLQSAKPVHARIARRLFDTKTFRATL